MKHTLTDIDAEARRGVCAVCGPTGVKPRAGRYGGWRCRTLENQGRRGKRRTDYTALAATRRPYRAAVGDRCGRCGFTGDPCQLDVDHRDGDHTNNAPDNLQTLCANCHRLKTHRPELFVASTLRS